MLPEFVHLLDDCLWQKKSAHSKSGRVVSTALVISKRPASLRKDAVLMSQHSHLETIGQKSATEELVMLKGKPKYVNGREPLEQPKVASI